jgi:TonB-dependent receptor
MVSVAASGLLAGQSFAQETEMAAGSGGSFEEIVVRGTKYQNLRALEAKRNTMQVMDAVSADEIGRLPDFNVGESLARVPGVSIRTDQGEARFVTIRGLNPDYNSTLLDGSTIAVPDRDGRNVFMEVLPASAAKRIEVFKTVTPDQEGHAVGGIVNLVTPSAYDYDDLQIKVQGEIGQYQQNSGFEGKKLSGDADFLVANTFGADDAWGLVVTGNYFQRDSYLPWAQFERFRFYDAGGNEVAPYTEGSLPAPGQRRYHWYHNDRQRYGGMGKLEYKPSTDVYSFFKMYYNIAKDDEARQTDVFDDRGGNTAINQTETSGTLIGTNFRTRQYVGQFNFKRSLWGGQLGTDYQMDDTNQLKLRASYSASLFKNPESFVEWRRDSADYAYSYERDGDAFNVTLNDPAAAFDFDNMPMNNYNFTDRRMKEKVWEVSADVVGDSLFSSDTLGYITGVKYRRLERNYNEDKFRYIATGLNTFSLGASGLATIDDVPKMPGILPGQGVISVDTTNVLPAVDADIAANPDGWTFDDQPNDDLRADYGVEENVFAAYAAITHETEEQRLVAGFRIEATSYDTSGNRLIDGVYGPVDDSGNYLNILPSINYTYRPAQDLAVRAAYSRTIGRPKFSEFAPSLESASTAGTQPTLSRSNPDLKPRLSDNIDISVEKYLDGGSGIIALAGFYKRIQDEIYVDTTEQLIPELDPNNLTLVSQPQNADNTTNLFGIELNLVKNFDFLPSGLDGFGGALNVTKIWQDFEYPAGDGTFINPRTMLGQSNKIINAALFYDKGKFNANLALNYTDIQADRFNNNPDNISYVDEDWQVDFKASYYVMDNLAITMNLYNILGESEDLVTGRYLEQPGRESAYGSAYFIGFSYSY